MVPPSLSGLGPHEFELWPHLLAGPHPSQFFGSGTLNLNSGKYVNQMQCTWVIFPDPGKYVRLTFSDFSVGGPGVK